jgi:hypothetical protein
MATTTKPLLPPDETFWQRYSPHHELPLAGVTSIFAHGMVFGTLGIAALLMMLRWDGDIGKPPSMDVVQLSGLGDGPEGAGNEPGSPEAADPAPNGYVPNLPNTPAQAVADATIPSLKEAPKKEFDVPDMTLVQPKENIEDLLNKIEKVANDQAKKEPPKSAPKVASAVGPINPKGVGGQGGSGGGPGKGNKGTGPGTGGFGRKATTAEIYANRWQFELMSSTIAGGQKEHVDKLMAMGVIVAFVDANGTVYFVQDLHRRPVSLKVGSMEKYKDSVQWTNQSAASIYYLAKELRLTFSPVAEIILLPKDREQAIADEELRYAQSNGRDPKAISKTWFDFRLRNGVYEPVVVKQE